MDWVGAPSLCVSMKRAAGPVGAYRPAAIQCQHYGGGALDFSNVRGRDVGLTTIHRSSGHVNGESADSGVPTQTRRDNSRTIRRRAEWRCLPRARLRVIPWPTTALRGRSGPPEAPERPVRSLFGLGGSNYLLSEIVAHSSVYAASSALWDCRFDLAQLKGRRNRRLMLATQQFGPELP